MEEIKDYALKVLKKQRNFRSKKELINKINKKFHKYSIKLEAPGKIGGFIFDAIFPTKDPYALFVVMKKGKVEGRNEVAYAISQLENAKSKGVIKAGMVIYITDDLDEWGTNDCLTFSNQYHYKGKDVFIEGVEYMSDWDSPLENKEPKHRYAIIFTKGYI